MRRLCDSSNNRQVNHDQEQRKWQNYDGRKNFNYQQQSTSSTDERIPQSCFDTTMNRQESTSEQVSGTCQNTDRQFNPSDRVGDSTC